MTPEEKAVHLLKMVDAKGEDVPLAQVWFHVTYREARDNPTREQFASLLDEKLATIREGALRAWDEEVGPMIAVIKRGGAK